MKIQSLFKLLFLFSILCFPLPSLSQQKEPIKSQIQQIRNGLLANGPRFSMTGTIKSGQETLYQVNGEDFIVGKDALIIGHLAPGKVGTVRGSILKGQKIAEKILVSDTPYARSSSSEISELEPEAITPLD